MVAAHIFQAAGFADTAFEGNRARDLANLCYEHLHKMGRGSNKLAEMETSYKYLQKFRSTVLAKPRTRAHKLTESE
eukprot:SAG22_NODE_14893_length_362_cov_0.908745_1_plen_75_part_10